MLLESTAREVAGKSPGNFWGSSGKSREFPEGLGSPTPSQRHAKIASEFLDFREVSLLWAFWQADRSDMRSLHCEGPAFSAKLVA